MFELFDGVVVWFVGGIFRIVCWCLFVLIIVIRVWVLLLVGGVLFVVLSFLCWWLCLCWCLGCVFKLWWELFDEIVVWIVGGLFIVFKGGWVCMIELVFVVFLVLVLVLVWDVLFVFLNYGWDG